MQHLMIELEAKRTEEAVELVREMRNEGHRLLAAKGKVIVTPSRARPLSGEHRARMVALKPYVLEFLQRQAVDDAFRLAVDVIARDWPTRGPLPQQDIETISREASLDAAMKAEPLDYDAALDSIIAWRDAWRRCVARAKGGRK